MIGESTTAVGAEHAFLWQRGSMTDLGSLNGNNSVARAINGAGDVVGDIDTPEGGGFPLEAVIWKDGKLTELGSFGAPGAEAVAVNDRGDVLVELVDRQGDGVGAVVLFHDGRQERIEGLGGSPPTGQGGSLIVQALNDRGQVLGFGYTERAAGRGSFIWQNGRATLLPTKDGSEPPWGAPVALNDAGEAIGTTYVRPRGYQGDQQHAIIWTPAHRER